MTLWSCFCFNMQSITGLNILSHFISLIVIALVIMRPSTARPQLMPSNGTSFVNATPLTMNTTSGAKSGFVRTNGASFELDGKPFTFGGSNLWSSQKDPVIV